MNSKEQAQAGNALIQWFNSQEIGQCDAEMIMSKVLAKMLTRGVNSRETAHKVVDTFTLQLIHDINDQLYSKRYGPRNG